MWDFFVWVVCKRECEDSIQIEDQRTFRIALFMHCSLLLGLLSGLFMRALGAIFCPCTHFNSKGLSSMSMNSTILY